MLTTLPSATPPVRVAQPEGQQIELLTQQLIRNHKVDPAAIQVARAPLRICPLGAHIDHQLGRVTGMTIDDSLLLAFAPLENGAVHVESANFERPATFALNNVPPYQRGDWGNYLRGAVLALQRNYRLERGLVGVIGGQMPIGGLSSSAAVTIAYLLALQAINRLTVLPKENIDQVRYTENEYIGLNNGILDQSVILCNQRNHLTLIDCESFEISQISSPLQPADFDIMVVYSGITHVLVGTDYNNRVAECQDAGREMLSMAGRPVPADPRLRHVTLELFEQYGDKLPDNLRLRAAHYFGEMQRVSDGLQAWQGGDMHRLGQLVTASGESSVKNYQCGSPQLITLYEILRDTPGVYGTRFSGAGFRGCCIALIDPAARESVAEAVHRRYPAAHPDEAKRYSIHFCRPDGSAEVIS